jgi:hypothetical protein
MSFSGWLAKFLGKDQVKDSSGRPIISDAVEVAGLDFRTAIDAHVRWKKRLESYIEGTGQEQLKVEVVSRDDQCVLGKWIYGEGGQRYGSHELFEELKTVHAKFHVCAGHVVTEVDQGRNDKAVEMLHTGDYPKVSARVKLLLARLYVQISGGASGGR